MSDDLSHDPHLRAALRHAPDHALVPPAGVSQTILNAARQVHKPARPAATPAPAVRVTVAPPRAIAWLRQWFASPRLAGGLATGLVAALGLGLWIDLEREPVIDRTPVQAAKELRSSDAVPAARAPAPEPEVAANQQRDAPSAPAAAVEAPRAKRAQRAAEAKAERAPAEPLRQAPAAPVPERRETEGALAKSAPAAAAPQAAAPVPPLPAPQPAPAVADSAPPDAATRSDSRMSSAAGRAAALAGARLPGTEPAADSASTASPAATLLRRARSERANGSARWTWMPPGKAAIVPVDAAGDAWLARVAQAARTRWTETAEHTGSGDALEVRWWRDDWPQATLRIETDGLRWIEHNGRAYHAPLDAATLERLRNL